MTQTTKSVGIIGYGAFGKVIAGLLSPYLEVLVYDKRTDIVFPDFVRPADIKAIADCYIVIIATDLPGIEQVCNQIAETVKPETIVMDICSVKVKPADTLVKTLSGKCRLLTTHPLFGPQSVVANGGTKGLKMVWHELESGPFPELEHIFTQDLGVELLRMSPEEHDKEMAWVQGLTFFVGRGLLQLNPPKSDLATHYYDELMDLVDLETKHSEELFMTIQRGNPYTDEVRQMLMDSLQRLEADITADNS